MGLTKHSFDLLVRHVSGGKMLELGNQTIYFGEGYGNPAKPMLQMLGFDHTSMDINGQDGALVYDLAKLRTEQPAYHKLPKYGAFDLLTDFGTSEHVSDFYGAWQNKYGFVKKGGLIISENPMTGNWPGHGLHYLTEDFYTELAKKTGMEILEIGQHPAMGNATDGWNVYCVLKKTRDTFITKRDFNKLDFRKS